MLGTLVFNIIAVLLAMLESYGKYRHGLKLALFTVFLFLALRFDFGNDYMSYLNMFESISKSNHEIKGLEFGWFYLNKVFVPFGFFFLQAFLAGCTVFILHRFIKKYVPRQYFWFAVFIYIFSPYQMLVLSSAMRQAVGVIIFLLSIDSLVEKKLVRYLLLISLAASFHTSAAFLYILIFIPFVNWKLRFYHLIFIAVIFTLPIFYIDKLNQWIELTVLQYAVFYESYIESSQTEINVGLGFALIVIINFALMWFMQKDDDYSRNILYKIAIISFLFIPISFGIHMIGRLSFYLTPILMVVYPLVFIRIKNPYFRLLFSSVVLLFTLYQFFSFFQSEVWRDQFSNYQTIFSAP